MDWLGKLVNMTTSGAASLARDLQAELKAIEPQSPIVREIVS